MKIRKLQLKNIGVFDDETIEFKPCPVKDKAEIHILTGQNGSGKSTILMALANSFTNFSVELANKSLYSRFNYHNEKDDFGQYFCSLKVFLEDKTSIGLNVVEDDSLFAFINGGIENEKIKDYLECIKHPNNFLNPRLSFVPFAFSGYRQIHSEKVEAIFEPKDFNPLQQSLEFVKDYSQPNQLSINQLIANNFSKKWIESSRNPEKSKKFASVLTSIEKALYEITGWIIEFDLKTEPTTLVTKINNEELDFDGLPDGLRSLISWIADLLGRVDLLKWQDDLPVFEKNLILFLDEIEVHLHPAWQRKVLPVVQKLFKNSQIFVSTHSPFVVNSVDDAWIYKLEVKKGKARVIEIVKSEDGFSYSRVLSEIFDIKEEFGIGVQKDLAKFKELRNKILESKNGSDKIQKEFLKLAKSLAIQSEELQTIIQFEIRQVNKRTGKNLAI
jgi:predicted ATP-binding protein involved in virulence